VFAAFKVVVPDPAWTTKPVPEMTFEWVSALLRLNVNVPLFAVSICKEPAASTVSDVEIAVIGERQVPDLHKVIQEGERFGRY